jgi:hypothetical protein
MQVLAPLRTLALNLLRSNGFRSIRACLMAVAHDISRMLGWVGISPAETGDLHHSGGASFATGICVQ